MKYAIIESGGKQYKTAENETIDVDRLPVEIGADIKLDKVLLVVEDGQIRVGTPTIDGVDVKAKVVSHVKGPKLIVFKYRPKKRIRVKTGHRQSYTRLLIEQVGETKVEKPALVEKPAKVKKATKTPKVNAEVKVPAKKVRPASDSTKKPAVKKKTNAEEK